MAVSYFRRERYEECLKFWDKGKFCRKYKRGYQHTIINLPSAAISLDSNHTPSIYNAGLTRALRNDSNTHLTIRYFARLKTRVILKQIKAFILLSRDIGEKLLPYATLHQRGKISR